VAVGALAAYGATTATFNVQLDDTVTGAIPGDFTVTVTTSNGCNTTASVPLQIRLNTDDLPASSATDKFDTGTFVWTAANDLAPTSTLLWSHSRKNALDGELFGVDSGAASDASIISPALTAGTGPLTITFDHKFTFEVAGATAFDGGVIEFTTNNGATWTDISTLTNPGYNVTLTGTPASTGNPLAGRPAFGNKNAANPATDTVTLNLGTALANQTFRLRFRVGSDASTGAAGWEIDNVAFSGIVGTPFPTLIPDPGHCNALTAPGGVVGDDGNDDQDPSDSSHDNAGCQAGGSGTGAGLALGMLAVLLRRRRR
jgi:uncharacterized protein (TIGR03382 family)